MKIPTYHKRIILLFFLTSLSLTGFCQSSDEDTLDKVKALSKIYGHVKYFYPGDEVAEADWEAFSVYATDKILIETDTDFIELLIRLFAPIAPGIRFYHKSSKPDSLTFIKSITPSDLSGYQPISWQHIGNGQFNTMSPYKSIRTNRPRILRPTYKYSEDFFISAVDQSHLIPGKYKLRYSVKSDYDNPFYRNNLQVCYGQGDDMTCKSVGYTDVQYWANYQYEFETEAAIDKVYLKISPVSEGTTLLKSLSLYRKEKKKWKKVNGLDFSSIDDIKILKRSTNYVSLYEHSIEKDSENKSNYLQITSIAQQKNDTLLSKRRVRFGEFSDIKLSDTTGYLMPLVLYGNDHSTFPATDKVALESLLTEMTASRKNFQITDQAYRIGNIVNLWNSIYHFYPYEEEIEDWSSVFVAAIQRSVSDLTNEDHQNTLTYMLAKLKDAHCYVSYKEDTKRYFPPFSARRINNLVIVTATAKNEMKIKKGDLITHVNGSDIGDLIDSALVLSMGGTKDIRQNNALDLILKQYENDPVSFTIRRGNIDLQIQTKATLSYVRYNQLKSKHSYLPDTRIFPDKTLYFDLTRISDEKLDSLTDSFNVYDHMIIDLRGYPNISGTIAEKLLAGLIQRPDTTNWLFFPVIRQPDRNDLGEEWIGKNWNINPAGNRFEGNIYLLTDFRAQSYAESIIGYFDIMDNVKIIGSRTAGVNGNAITMSLPGGFSYRWTGMKVIKQDGSKLHGLGFQPDIHVQPFSDGIASDEDEVLSRALAEIEKK